MYTRSLAAVALGLAAMTGCSSDPYHAADKANMSLADTKTELLTDKQNLKTATDDLNDLVYHPATDLRPQFEKYSKDVDNLEKSVAASRRSAKGMTTNREAYLAQWRADTAAIQDTDLRMRAMDRINETEKNFSVVTDKLMAADDAVQPLVKELRAMDTYLGGDLTAGGIKYVTDRATDAKNKSIAVNAKIDDAINELDKVSDQIAPISTTRPSTMSSSNGM